MKELRKEVFDAATDVFKKEMAYFLGSPSPLLDTLTHLICLYSPKLPVLALCFSSQFSKPSLIYLIFFDNFTAAYLHHADSLPLSLSKPIFFSISVITKGCCVLRAWAHVHDSLCVYKVCLSLPFNDFM